ncbi:MAG: aminotransferase class I/II-fold pyridoxal phosphate-dependent enzyme [Woeseiaceae bacterium]|nr:aminotransferase class I/II-fold pyridoxal phosphate-dependent enzyme [Woeseiaceae bacterium]
MLQRDFELEVFFAKWEFAARHHLTASDAQSMSLAELLALAEADDRAVFDELWLGYTETQGAPDLRATIATTYDALGAEHIQCFAGAEEGVYVAMRVLLEPGDHAIVIVPNYQAAETVPLDICEVTGVPLREDRNWQLDIDTLRGAVRPNTRLVSINFPNNPTGYIPDQRDFASIVDLCREHDLFLFSDEVYRLLELDDDRRVPQAADVYEKGFSLNVMSKAYGLPGLRIGWIASPDTDALARFNRYKHYLSICNSAPSERLAIIALKARDRILDRNRRILAGNLELLDRFFARHDELFDWRRPDGGCVAFPRYKGPDGVETFCERLVHEAGVLLLPASIYRSDLLETPADRFRIGCGRLGLDDGLAAFDELLA